MAVFRRQPLDRIPPRPHFQYVAWVVYDLPFGQRKTNDPGRQAKGVRPRGYIAGIKADLLYWKVSGVKFKSLVSSRSALSQSLQGSSGPPIDHKSWWLTDSYVRRSSVRSRLCPPNSCIR